MRQPPRILSRRSTLAGLGAIGVCAPAGHAPASPRRDGACILTPRSIEGPFYFDPHLQRSDITEGRPGARMRAVLTVVAAGACQPLGGLRVDLWHADAGGEYSGFDAEGQRTRGSTFMRGTQFTDARGHVAFETVYPGWYSGRATHVHYKVFPHARAIVTGQMYFPDDLNAHVYRSFAAYRGRAERREVTNRNDFILNRDDPHRLTICSMQNAGGHYVAALTIGIAAR